MIDLHRFIKNEVSGKKDQMRFSLWFYDKYSSTQYEWRLTAQFNKLCDGVKFAEFLMPDDCLCMLTDQKKDSKELSERMADTVIGVRPDPYVD